MFLTRWSFTEIMLYWYIHVWILTMLYKVWIQFHCFVLIKETDREIHILCCWQFHTSCMLVTINWKFFWPIRLLNYTFEQHDVTRLHKTPVSAVMLLYACSTLLQYIYFATAEKESMVYTWFDDMIGILPFDHTIIDCFVFKILSNPLLTLIFVSHLR